MQILPITSQNSNSTFKGLRYQNGIKTKNALTPNVTKMLALLEKKCSGMKNVDLILTDESKLQLNILSPRYLNPKFNRFYREENYETGKYDSGNFYFHNIKDHDYLRIKLLPTDEIGIFNVVEDGSTNFGTTLSDTLLAADLIEKTSDKIKAAEKEYGMDCVRVLDNIDDLTIEAERAKLIDDIKKSYVVLNEKKLDRQDIDTLYLLTNNKVGAESLENYKIGLGGYFDDSIMDVYLVDSKGYLDEAYKEFYEKDGLKIENYSETGRKLSPLHGEYPYYSFGTKDGKSYGVCLDTYEMGSNLSCVDRDHFKKLLSIAGTLDRIAHNIDKYLKS